MNGDQLLDIIGRVDNDLVHAAGQYRKKPLAWKKWLAAAACLALVCAMAVSYRNFEAVPQTPQTPQSPTLMPWGTGQRPLIRYNGRTYRWEGISRQVVRWNGLWILDPEQSSWLPEGCVEIGPLAGVTAQEPTGDLVLQADFDTSGTVWQDPAHPEVLYLHMTAGWTGSQGLFYVRFITDALGDNQLLCWKGRTYCLALSDGDRSPEVSSLPEGCVPVGRLTFSHQDALPQRDLETNAAFHFTEDHPDNGTVYTLPGDDSVIYVYRHRYRANGDCPAWLTCPLWE